MNSHKFGQASLDAEDIKRYVARRQQDVAQCLEALEAKDFEALREFAHKMLGNCETFGFPEIADFALQLQEASREQKSAESRKALADLQSWAENTLKKI